MRCAVDGSGQEYRCGVSEESRPIASQGRVSYPQEAEGWSEVSTLFLHIGPLVQTTSGNASKVTHPVSQTGPSVVVGPTMPVQQKSSFRHIPFELKAFSEIHESKSEKTCYCRKDTYLHPKCSGGADSRITNKQTHTQNDYRKLSLRMHTYRHLRT